MFRTFATLDEQEEREVCARIKQARIEAGLKQQQMADLLHTEKRTYQNYEATRVPFRRLDEIAKITGRPREWLLYGDGPGFLNRIARMESAVVEMDKKLDRMLEQMRATRVAEAVEEAGQASQTPAAESSPAPEATEKRNRRGS